MMHRLECGGVDACLASCQCLCHRRCGFLLPLMNEPCWRLSGHSQRGRGKGHRSRLAVESWTRKAA